MTTMTNPTVKHHRLYLLGIILIAAALRLSYLTAIPNGFSTDEAAIGYDAYSLLETGRDQYGELFPMFTRAFADYDEALYRYLTIPFILLFGLTEFAIRLPAAITGILTIWVLYCLTKTLLNPRLALLAALFLAISPWHVIHSRWAVRAILLPLFFCLGLFYFLQSEKKPATLIASAFAFAISLHTYNSARVFVPLFMGGLVGLSWDTLWKSKKQTFIAAGLFFSIFIPLFTFWISPEGMERANETLVTNPYTILSDYLSYYHPQFLFFSGDIDPMHNIPNMGKLHYLELITVLVGMYGLLKKGDKKHRLLWLWLLLYPIPAALTDPYKGIRAIMGAPLFAVFSACGLGWMADRIQSKIQLFKIGTAMSMLASVAIFLKFGLIDYPRYSAKWWSFGMKEAVMWTEKSPHKAVVVSHMFLPHIYLLFYTQHSPSDYLSTPLELRLKFWRHTPEALLDRYYTMYLQNPLLDVEGTALFMVAPGEIEYLKKRGYQCSEVHTIRDPLGEELIQFFEVTSPP